MFSPPPNLSHADLSRDLQRFHSTKHRCFDTAFFGHADAGSIRVEVLGGEREFKIIPVNCELHLRQELQAAKKDNESVVLLVDFTERLPPDVLGRLAGGHLQFITRDNRIGNLFGVKNVAPALLDSPLSEALLRTGWIYTMNKTATTVDLTTAWRCFLERSINLSREENLTEEGVLHFLAFQSPAAVDSSFATLLETIAELPEALEKFWLSTVGPIANLAWRNWKKGAASEVAAMAFVLDALVGSKDEGAVKVFIDLRLEKYGKTKGLHPSILVERWARLASRLALRLGEETSILKLANRMVDTPGLQDVLGNSQFLNAGFQRQKVQLAELLQSAVAKVDGKGQGTVARESVKKAEGLYRQLASHHQARLPENKATLDRILMGLRLLAYLSVRPDWGVELKDATPVEPVFRLAQAYANEGGFVDYARGLVRGGNDEDPLDAAIAKVADAIDAYRDSMDHVFAKALVPWNEGRRTGRVLPIEEVLAEVGVSFLAKNPRRKLLILLVDGLSWATAAELLFDIRDIGYSTLRWQPPKATLPGMPVPVIAALPTITEVSRAALFAGKLLPQGEAPATLRDPDRLRANKAFVKLLGDGPALLLRTEAESLTGQLTPAARKLIESSDRAVGLVINAVDDQLSGKPGYQVATNRTTIKALEPILLLAKESNRAVLLLGDHGHVVSSRPHSVLSATKAESPRFRELEADEAPLDREIVVSGPNAFVSKKNRRLALLYGETDRYISKRHVGEHGGASLAEVVTPALMLGSQDLQVLMDDGGEEDEAMNVVAYPVPAWWHLDLPVEKPAIVVQPIKEPIKAAAKPKKSVSDAQLDFLAIIPAEAPIPAPTKTPVLSLSKWADRLKAVFADADKLKKQDLLKRVIPAVELLVEYNGRVAEDVFAGRLGEALRNVGGCVALLSEFLNEDGYQVIVHDSVGKQVRLDLDRLDQLFGGA